MPRVPVPVWERGYEKRMPGAVPDILSCCCLFGCSTVTVVIVCIGLILVVALVFLMGTDADNLPFVHMSSASELSIFSSGQAAGEGDGIELSSVLSSVSISFTVSAGPVMPGAALAGSAVAACK